MCWRVVLLEIKTPQLTVAVYCQSKWVLFEAKLLTLLLTGIRIPSCCHWLHQLSIPTLVKPIFDLLKLHSKSSYILIFTLNKGIIPFLPPTAGPGWEMQGVWCCAQHPQEAECSQTSWGLERILSPENPISHPWARQRSCSGFCSQLPAVISPLPDPSFHLKKLLKALPGVCPAGNLCFQLETPWQELTFVFISHTSFWYLR